MYDMKSFLVDQPKVSDWWTGHFDLYTSKDHAMCKLIDFLHMREQINYIYLLTSQGHNENIIERNKEKKPLNPEVTPFTPQENQSTTQTSSTETKTPSSDTIDTKTTSSPTTNHRSNEWKIVEEKKQHHSNKLEEYEKDSPSIKQVENHNPYAVLEPPETEENHEMMDEDRYEEAMLLNNNLKTENEKLHKEISTLKASLQTANDDYNVETMTVGSLQQKLKELEEDYAKVTKEADVSIEKLKNERHDLKVQAHHDKESSKTEVNYLKSSLVQSRNSVKETETIASSLQVNVETLENCVEDLKEEMQVHVRDLKRKEHNIQQMKATIDELNDELTQKKLREQELTNEQKEWEEQKKEVDDLKNKNKNLEIKIRFKQTVIENLHRHLPKCGNAEIEAAFKGKDVTGRKKRR